MNGQRGIPLRGFLHSYSEEVHAQRADETAVVIVDCQIGPRPVGGGRAKKIDAGFFVWLLETTMMRWRKDLIRR